MSKKLNTSGEARIFGRIYDIFFVPGLGVPAEKVSEKTIGGIIDADRKRPAIVVDKNQPTDVQRETLLHEMTHGGDRATCGGPELPEETIDRMARAQYGIGRDNPLLMTWIFLCGQPKHILRKVLILLAKDEEDE